MTAEIKQQAAEWLEKKDHLSTSELDQFQTWINADPRHEQVYTRLESLYASQELTESLRTFRQQQSALTVTSAQNRKPQTKKRSHLFGFPAGQVAAISCMLIIAALVYFPRTENTQSPKHAHIENTPATKLITQVGQRDKYISDDGSVIDLNALTHIEVGFTKQTRQISMKKGEAYFQVAKDKSRPFVVETKQAEVRVLGTVFNVEQRDNQLIVKVDEGHVQVTPKDSNKVIDLYANQMVTIQGQTISDIIRLETEFSADWKSGWTHIQSQPIDTLLAQLQRYVDKPILVGSISQKVPIISGRYKLDDPITTLKLVAELNNLVLIEDDHAFYLEDAK